MHFIEPAISVIKKDTLPMSTSKSLNYLHNQNIPPTAVEEAFDEDSFIIGATVDISNEVKNNNQQTNTIAEWSVTLNTNGTNIYYKIDFSPQVNVIPENQIETLQTKQGITKSMNLEVFQLPNASSYSHYPYQEYVWTTWYTR